MRRLLLFVLAFLLDCEIQYAQHTPHQHHRGNASSRVSPPPEQMAYFEPQANWPENLHRFSFVELKGPLKRTQGSQYHYLDVIFGQIGTINRYFVEFGFNEESYESGGSGANTRKLYECGWRGLLLTAESENPSINLQKSYLSYGTVGPTFQKNKVPTEFDYLSVDMDSWDLFVMEGIFDAGYRPRVISTEYNSNYPLGVAISQIDPTLLSGAWLAEASVFVFRGCMWGASAGAWRVLMSRFGYTMIGLVEGLDIFWIRNDILSQHHHIRVPRFEWFFENPKSNNKIGVDTQHGYVTNSTWLELLVDNEVLDQTKNITLARASVRQSLSRLNLKCFAEVKDALV